MKQGKSYTRRYWEDLFERFETESKWIDNQKKLNEEKDKIEFELQSAHHSNLLSGDELQKYLQRLREVKLHNEREQEYREQVINLNDDVTTARERLIHSREEERKTMSLSDLKEQIKQRKNESEKTASANGLKDEIHIDHTEEKEKQVKSDKEIKH